MTQPTTAVNPDEASISALRAQKDDGPVVMVNLLDFDGPAGRAAYARYARVSGSEIAARGGRVLYSGQAVTVMTEPEWDSIALVYYPRRAGWLDMQDSPAYQAAIADRTAGLQRRLLFAFREGTTGPVAARRIGDVKKPEGDAIHVANLLAFNGTAGRESYGRYGDVAGELIAAVGGKIVMVLDADQALVSDHAWEKFILVRYPDVDALRSMTSDPRWQAANTQHRQSGLAATIALVTR